ncbi:hypothetical protein [Paenibacillus crassostreae]|uniref:Uncharacterized protein n=1 Tax=Paenibacillus crassostreae TaxID=1763538 RepID=A0A167C675_9BACL|nr:hypothetical protein [Paenibacillus crassostreae]AOZ91596.1 hypothetical protein LPB68_04780 [Paenibacillus crassostreae]OAB72829.1 hypothetical protein PNBC_15470 [Paenibacillus crassostreae]
MKIKMIKNYSNGTWKVKTGDEFKVRKLNREGIFMDQHPEFQIIESPMSGIIIPYHYAVLLPEERTYTVAEYSQLREINDQVQRQRDKAIDDLAQHAGTLVQIQQELVQERESKKVLVPREVADALDLYVSDGHDDDAKGWALFNIIKCKYDDLDIPARLIKNHFGMNYFALASVIVNSYTVEQTPEEQFTEGITNICARFDDEHPDDVEYEELVSFAFEISDFVQKHNKS